MRIKLRRAMSHVFTFDSSFELLPEETILEGLERTGHDVEFQCRSGYCGSCRIKVLVGEVEYKDEPLAFVSPGEILPCCCRPKGEQIKLDIHSKKEPPDESPSGGELDQKSLEY